MKAPIVGIIVNPNSAGYRRILPIVDLYRGIMGNRGIIKVTGGKGELTEAASAFLDKGVEILAVAGGDGTLHATLNAFLPVFGGTPFPIILLVQAGTINNMSSELNMKRSGLDILHDILKEEKEITLRKVSRRLMLVNEEYGFLYGSGFPVSFLKRYYGAPRQGMGTAIYCIFSSIFYAAFCPERGGELFKRSRARITLDGDLEGEEEFLFIIASTILNIGLNFRPCYLALNREGLLHIIASSSEIRRILPRLGRIYLGRPLEIDCSIDKLAREALIEMDIPSPYMVDGEIKRPAKRHLLKAGMEVSFIRDLERK